MKILGLSCRDIGGDCKFKVSSNSIEEIKSKFEVHLRNKHQKQLAKLNEKELKQLIEIVGKLSIQKSQKPL